MANLNQELPKSIGASFSASPKFYLTNNTTSERQIGRVPVRQKKTYGQEQQQRHLFASRCQFDFNARRGRIVQRGALSVFLWNNIVDYDKGITTRTIEPTTIESSEDRRRGYITNPFTLTNQRPKDYEFGVVSDK